MKKLKKFVVQQHQRESEPTHWDLMLERDGILETYRVAEPPEEWGKRAIEAVKIFDHQLKFLSYEGSVNDGKGRVEIADCGTYRLIKKDKTQQQISFAGKLLRVEYRLCLIKNDRWELRGF
ncbi:MAG: DNA polymerase ligase N-terminal domain-containing protein [Sedimentisphaerales bacterium]